MAQLSKPKIHAVTHIDPLTTSGKSQTWCGPSAVSSITGRSAECTAAWVNDYRRRPLHHLVYGSQAYELAHALRALGYALIPRYVLSNKRSGPAVGNRPVVYVPPPGLTLAKFSRVRGKDVFELLPRSSLYLVNITDHWLVLQGNKVVCSAQTKGVTIGKARKRRARVKKVWEVRFAHGYKAEDARRKRGDTFPTEHEPSEGCPALERLLRF